jgi:hypothetical protein
MTALDNLHIKSFDVLFAKGGHVLLRYAATGTHQGAPHNGIQPTHKEAHWTACAIFEVEGGKIKSFIKVCLRPPATGDRLALTIRRSGTRSPCGPSSAG